MAGRHLYFQVLSVLDLCGKLQFSFNYSKLRDLS